jgi:hypothetical protein
MNPAYEARVDGEYHCWFESFEEYERVAPGMIQRANASEYHLLQNYRRDESWLGIGADGTYAKMMDKVRNGWNEYRVKVQELADQIKEGLEIGTVEAMQMDVRKRKRRRSDQGDTLDMQRVWNGELDRAWERPERVPRRAPSQRYATIYLDLSAAARHSAHAGIYRAACAMSICDLLTVAGFATEIWCGDSSRNPHVDRWAGAPQLAWTGVRVKEYSQPLNEDRLAALSSVGALRTLGFSMLLCSPWRVCMTYGTPHNRGLVLPLRERRDNEERVIRIGECWSIEAARAELSSVAFELSGKEAA